MTDKVITVLEVLAHHDPLVWQINKATLHLATPKKIRSYIKQNFAYLIVSLMLLEITRKVKEGICLFIIINY